MSEITFVSNNEEVVNTLQEVLGDSAANFTYKYMIKDIRKKEDLGEYDVYISPANSFGELQGGIDMQYFLHFGRRKLQEQVYAEIKNRYQGEVLIGEFCKIDILDGKILLLCPTMTLPTNISQTRNVYYFTRAMIKGLTILKKSGYCVNRVFCPIPGVGVGGMESSIAAKQMKMAFDAFSGSGAVIDVYSDVGNVLQAARIMCISMLRNH